MKDLTMKREILLEKASYIRGKFYAAKENATVLEAIHDELFKLGNEILSADEKKLAEIDAIFSFADKVISGVKGDNDESK